MPERPARTAPSRRGTPGLWICARWICALSLCAGWPLAGLGACGAPREDSVLLATTTSLRDTGLLDALLPDFEVEKGIEVRLVAVGSGAALRMGRDGNADILITHAPEGERELIAEGSVVERRPWLENYFVIAGPREDPAGVRGAASALEALQRIATAGAPWVSRDDDSGTHRRERALLRAAGLDPDAGWPTFSRTGSGMALSLQVAGERRAYILSDRGTFLAFRKSTHLAALSKPEPALRNIYSILLLSPERYPRVRHGAARRLASYLGSAAALARAASFGVERFGAPLFSPASAEVGAERDAPPSRTHGTYPAATPLATAPSPRAGAGEGERS